MLTFKSANYKKNDLRLLLEVLGTAYDAIECNNTCDNCPYYKVCGDMARLKAYVSNKYNHELAKKG